MLLCCVLHPGVDPATWLSPACTCSFLRVITTGQGPEERNQTRQTGFDITVRPCTGGT